MTVAIKTRVVTVASAAALSVALTPGPVGAGPPAGTKPTWTPSGAHATQPRPVERESTRPWLPRAWQASPDVTRRPAADAAMLSVDPEVPLEQCSDDPAWLCGSVEVPVDRAEPEGRLLDIAFAVLPHSDQTSTATDALFASDGGPGQSNVANRWFLRDLAGDLTADRDLVVVDHRGTGQSGAIDCAEMGQVFEDPDFTADEIIAAIGRCGHQLGPDADRYGSGDVAKDLDVVRAALGYDQISIYGMSYGGVFASAYATRFADRLRAVVIDAGTPVTDPRHAWTWGNDIRPAMAEVIATDCLRSPACVAAQPRARSALARLAAAVRRAPVRGTVQVPRLGRRRVVVDEVTLTHLAQDWLNTGELAAAARALDSGDEKPLLRLAGEALMSPYEAPDPTWWSEGDNAAAFCNDTDGPWDRTDSVPVREDKYEQALAVLGPDAFAPLSPTAWTEYFLSDYCLKWPAPDRFTPAISAGRTFTDAPVLILSGDRDTIVPTATTRELLRVFPEARVLQVAGAGHPAVGWSTCASDAYHAFVRTPDAPITPCDEPAYLVPTTSKFPERARSAVPARRVAGDRSRPLDRKVATAVVQTVRDAWLRSWRVPGDKGPLVGLRGGAGRYDYAGSGDHATLKLRRFRFTTDVALTGTATWTYQNGVVRFDMRVDGPGKRDGSLTGRGPFAGPRPFRDYVVRGSIHDRAVRVSVVGN